MNAFAANSSRLLQAHLARLVLKVMGVCFVCLSCSSAPAFGDIFQGTFTERILATDDTGLYSVGQTFFGSYQYTAETANGGFCSLFYHGSTAANKTLDGVVVMPFSKQTSYVISYPTPDTQYYLNYGLGGITNSLVNSGNGGKLTVDDNQVTGFTWSWEQGGFYFSMQCTNGVGTFQTASFYDTPSPVYTSGTIEFTGPSVIQTTPVPEPGGVFLIAGAVGLVFALRFARAGRRN